MQRAAGLSIWRRSPSAARPSAAACQLPFRVRPCRLRARARLAESAAVGTEALQMAAASSGSALARAVPACPRDLPSRLRSAGDASPVRGNKGARQMRSCDDSRARSARAQSFRPSRATAAPPRAQASQRLLLSDSCADHRCAKDSPPRAPLRALQTFGAPLQVGSRACSASSTYPTKSWPFRCHQLPPRRANQLPRLAAAGWLTRSSATAFTWLAPAWASPRARRPWRCSFWAPCPCWARSSRPCR